MQIVGTYCRYILSTYCGQIILWAHIGDRAPSSSVGGANVTDDQLFGCSNCARLQESDKSDEDNIS